MFVYNLQNFFSNGATVETIGEIFEKLAVEYNGSALPTKGEATAIHKRCPNLSNAITLSKKHRQSGTVAYKSLDKAEKTLNQQSQTDWLSIQTLKRAFCMILILVVFAK